MSFLSSLFGSKVPAIHSNDASLTQFLHYNNAPVSGFCNTIPILAPPFVTTEFGWSVITLGILLVYLLMYLTSSHQTAIESRLLTALVLGNVAYCMLAFESWFELHYHIVFCNEYKNGQINLYQVSEYMEKYKLKNVIGSYTDFIVRLFKTYSVLVYKQFVLVFGDATSGAYTFFVDGTEEAYALVKGGLKL